jgi:hypothetical protein
MADRPVLLAVVEFLGNTALKPLYEGVGYQVATEFSVRKANAAMRKLKPGVIAADFYHEPNFRDRLSNLESLLAAAQGLAEKPRLIVYYDAAHQAALDKVRQRFAIDAAFTLPVNTSDVEATLRAWGHQALGG